MRYLFCIISLLLFHTSIAQKAYKTGDVVANFSIKKLLNYETSPTDLTHINQDLLVLDFFGTWCIPCLKALPHLTELQQQFGKRVRFLLVSNEDEGLLREFADKRKLDNLPIAVDADKEIELLFKPVSYPYTVVINKSGLIVATPSAAEMTSENIERWLASNKSENVPIEKHTDTVIKPSNITVVESKKDAGILNLSAEFIYASKTGAPVKDLQQQLNSLSLDMLKNELTTDDKKKAFWINIYNGFTQLLLKNNPAQYKSRSTFFKAKQINIAGRTWSLDEIEHDILRRSKIKWSLGYLNKLFPGKTEKALRVDAVDFRIHFALNCGAKSCPPIAFYKSSSINDQLNTATKAYLSNEATYDAEHNTVHLPAIMGWFRGDFDGKKNMRKLLQDNGVTGVNEKTKIRFKKYDWSLYLNNYTN